MTVSIMTVVFEMLRRGAHDLFENLGKVILIEESQAVCDRFDRLILVLQHLACPLHFHGSIQIKRRLHGLLFEQCAVMRYGQSCGRGEILQRYIPMDIFAHVFDALDHAVFFRVFFRGKYRQPEGTKETVKAAVRIHEVFNILEQFEMM